jgi:hypothetical protein
VLFARLLARLAGAPEWVLKGGVALQLRYDLMARPTNAARAAMAQVAETDRAGCRAVFDARSLVQAA